MRVAINGLGRIGRAVLKIGLKHGINFVAINDLTDTSNLAYLMKHDSVYGSYDKKVVAGKDFLKIGNKRIKVFSNQFPENIPWKEVKADVIVESTGLFRDREKAKKHFEAGAKKVVISATSKDPDIMVVLGVNHNQLKPIHKIISNASCTTNCLAPVVRVLDDSFGVKKGFMTTVHAYTSSQKIIDGPQKKFRRGRAGALNIVPTTSGGSTAVARVIPKLRGKLDGLALRVPVANGSITDFICELKKSVTKDQVNNAFKNASKSSLKGIMQNADIAEVSID